MHITFPSTKTRSESEPLHLFIPCEFLGISRANADYTRIFGLPVGSFILRSPPSNEHIAWPPNLGVAPSDLSDLVKACASTLGPLPPGVKFSGHSTRRSLATWLHWQGVPEEVIKKLIGWSGDSVQRYYRLSAVELFRSFGLADLAAAKHNTAWLPKWSWPASLAARPPVVYTVFPTANRGPQRVSSSQSDRAFFEIPLRKAPAVNTSLFSPKPPKIGGLFTSKY